MMRIAFILSFILSLACASYGQMQMSMRGGGKPIYYPFQLDSLFYWFDASDAATLQDSLGGAIANNEGVATWADKSGRNWDVTQGTNTARPVYKATGGPGGNTPAVQFDGTNDFLASAAHWWGSDDLTVFVVMKFGNATRDATEQIINKIDFALNQRQWGVQGLPNVVNGGYEEDAVRLLTASDGSSASGRYFDDGLKSTSYSAISAVHDGTSNGGSIYVNGASQAITTYGTGDGTIYDYSQPVKIGYTTSDGIGIHFLQGSISEIIVYTRALSDSERVGVEQYLKQKWGL